MMKRKVVSMCLVCLTMLSLSVMPVKAQEWSSSFQVSSGFNSSWSRNYTFEFKVDPSVSHYLTTTYGYSKFSQKDYVDNVQGTPQGYYGKGIVTNSDGTSDETDWIASGFKSSKAEVKHTGTATYTGKLKN